MPESKVRVGVIGKLAVTGRFEPLRGLPATSPPGERVDDLDHLAKVVRGEAAPAATGQDARANLAACPAFYELATTGGFAEPGAREKKAAAGGVA